jgi:hypothetical protein
MDISRCFLHSFNINAGIIPQIRLHTSFHILDYYFVINNCITMCNSISATDSNIHQTGNTENAVKKVVHFHAMKVSRESKV